MDASPRTCTGPGGASIEIGLNMWTASGLKIDSAPTDVVWARGRELFDLYQLASGFKLICTKNSTIK